MKKTLLLILTVIAIECSFAQNLTLPGVNSPQAAVVKSHAYNVYFQNAYSQFPDIPKGTLEAVAYTMTRIHHIDSASTPESCTGMPRVYGVMGLTLNGKNYFRNNLNYISQLAGFSVNDIIFSPEINILAFAKAYSVLLKNSGISSSNIEDQVPVLISLSELPDNDVQTNFALNAHLYSVLSLLNFPEFQAEYSLPGYNINLENIFGKENLKVLSSPNVIISGDTIQDKGGNQFQKKSGDYIPETFSSDYGPAIWNAAASCNYSSRNGTAISAITIHDVEGSYSGCISWFKNCAASVSAHYVLRSSDGQITQMVLESNKAWHVGSENPYTIGFEHEGYRNQTGWYTVAMYTASADLARDICNSGYGINPSRAGFQPWMGPTEYNSAGIPGSCVRIKGHQHYPNQTHNDPGPNWDWRYFYNKINNNPTVTTLTAGSGTFYDSGGATGNYTDDEDLVWTINPSGSTSVTVSFSSFNVENTWDYLYIYDGPDIWSPLIGTYTGTTSPGTVNSSGGSITFQFISDCSTTAAGWNANWTSTSGAIVPTNLTASVSSCPNNDATLTWNNSGTGWYVDISTDPAYSSFYNKNVDGLTSTGCPAGFCDYPNCTQPLVLQPNTTYYWRIWNGSSHTDGQSFTTNNCDNTPPTTQISPVNNWETQNFSVSFTDADNVGVAQSFFQVLDWNGTEWRANFSNGFFNDNFDAAVNAEWTNAGGTWAIASAFLNQSDEANGNTNIYTNVNQTSSFTYLYHWQMKMGGTGTNKRAGIHFFSDNSTLPNRGNGYFVYFRVDNQLAQIYKVVNDVFSLESDVAYSFSANTFYDFKTTFNPQSGEIKVYINDVYVSSWTDASPFTGGNSISLRTGNCTADYNDLKVYRSRTATETVTIGNSSADVRYQNPNPSTPSCRIKSIVTDGSENWSSPATLNVNIDWTAPADVLVNDGPSSDIDTTNINTELTANWTTSVDTHSAITTYWYAIGTSQGATDVVNWVNYGNNTSVTHTGLSLTYGITYYLTVQVENGAGLLSNEIYSDGQLLIQPLPPPSANFTTANNTICSGETINFQNNSTDADSFAWSFPGGNPASSTSSNPSIAYTGSGTYSVTLIAYSTGITSDTLMQNISITVNSAPAATFSGDSTIVYLPNATVNFSNSSANSTAYQWDFGDGSSDTLADPSHTYSDTGYYSVTLIAVNGLCNNDTLVMTNYIYVGPDPTLTAPVAGFFTSGFGYACESDSVSFVNNSTDATSYQWAFANGTPGTSYDVNPSVLYDSSGNYAVTLIASGPGGVDTLQQTVSINVVLPPLADLSANDTVAYLPNDTIVFTNLSDNATNFSWDFGDGTTSFDTDPNHSYTDTGYFTVTLIAGNDNCPDDTVIYANYIFIGPATIAGFTNSSTTICSGELVDFTNTSSYATSYSWNFSGGTPSTSTSANPSISFSASGNFSVSLIATGPGGNDTVTQTISINAVSSPNANFTATPTTVYLPNATVIFSNSSVNATSWSWDFGDGSSATLTTPSHTYNDTGYFTITLIAINGTCPDDTLIMNNYIYVDDTTTTTQPPVANFTTSSANICSGDLIDFTNTSVNATTYSWTFTGGTPATSTTANPSVSYVNSGTYNVTLIANGAGGSDTVSQTVTVTVSQPPAAIFSATDTVIDLPPGIAFFNNSSANATSYLWNFGDGTTSADPSPWHQYNDTGYFTITLIAINGNCPNDTLAMTNYIYVGNLVDIKEPGVAGNRLQIYPNPGDKIFVLEYYLPQTDNLNISFTDVLGKEIFICYNKKQNSGKHRLFVDAEELKLSKGLYLLQFQTNNFSESVKILVR